MPYIDFSGTNLIDKTNLEKFKKDLTLGLARALDETPDRIWVKYKPKGYYNQIKDKFIAVIALYFYEDEEAFERVVQVIDKLRKKYQLDFGMDVHLVGEKYYHSFFSRRP